MKEDLIVTGAIAGTIGNICQLLFNFGCFLIGWTKYTYFQIAASVFVVPDRVNTWGALLLGMLADLVVGASFGIALLYIVNKTGNKFLAFKGLGLAWIMWLVLFGLIVNIHIVRITPTDIGTNQCAFFSHLILGLVTAWWLKRSKVKAFTGK